jgi:hypothetical protein
VIPAKAFFGIDTSIRDPDSRYYNQCNAGRIRLFGAAHKEGGRMQRWITLAALLFLLPASAATPGDKSPTVLRFERSIYFEDPGGTQVLAQPGLYAVTVTAEGSRLRLYPAGGEAPLTLATETTHHEETKQPLPLALILSEEDEVHVALLLPERKALDARGSYSGARPSGSPGASPESLAQGYRHAATARRKQVGRGYARGKPPPGSPMPSWTDIEITTNLGAQIYMAQLVDETWSAFRASPGARISVSGFAIPDVESVDAIRLVIYAGFYEDPQIRGQDEFGRVRVPLKLDHISRDRRSFSAVLDVAASGLPPGPAYLEIDYRQAGAFRTIALGSVPGPGSPSVTWLRYRLPPLYFVPEYAVYVGDVQIHIEESGLGEEVASIVDPLGGGLVYPPYWLLQRVSLEPASDFDGTKPYLRAPCASARVPEQGYHVKMEPPASGTATMTFQLVGPRGMQPPGVRNFDSFDELESYGGATDGALPVLPVNPRYVDWLPTSGLVGPCQGRRP